MFSRVLVSDAGDTDLLAGDITEKDEFEEVNLRAKEKGAHLAAGEKMLLGITKVALSTESFLSAASFQETARVLINAAVAGKEDKLRGLKENVILGKLIPAGTGYRGAK
jgi:DNA-directed RNA polymerase subunit beta'